MKELKLGRNSNQIHEDYHRIALPLVNIVRVLSEHYTVNLDWNTLSRTDHKKERSGGSGLNRYSIDGGTGLSEALEEVLILFLF